MVDIQEITSGTFRAYGRVLNVDTEEFLQVMDARPVTPAGQADYVTELPELATLPLGKEIQTKVFGELPVEFGHCSGWNNHLNALEFHRSSEIDIAATDLLLLLGHEQDIDWDMLTYNTDRVECFHVPRGTAVELYATTLHYTPCRAGGKEFRMGVILPAGTNEALSCRVQHPYFMQAKNTWLLAHKEADMGPDVCYGLRGENLCVD